MDNRFNTLLHGAAFEAAEVLSGDSPPEGEQCLRAALTNALNRIETLERLVEQLNDRMNMLLTFGGP